MNHSQRADRSDDISLLNGRKLDEQGKKIDDLLGLMKGYDGGPPGVLKILSDHDEMLRLFTQAAQQAKEETRRLRKVENQLRQMTERWDRTRYNEEPPDETQSLSPGRVFLSRLSNWTR